MRKSADFDRFFKIMSDDVLNLALRAAGSNSSIKDSQRNSPTNIQQRLRDHIAALRFDAKKERVPLPARKDSETLVAELLGERPDAVGKKGGQRSKSKAGFWPGKSSSGHLNKGMRSQPQLQRKDKPEPGFTTIIKEWGKRPLLVESEAPWTPRNRMYLNAVKALTKVTQRPGPPVTANMPPANPPPTGQTIGNLVGATPASAVPVPTAPPTPGTFQFTPPNPPIFPPQILPQSIFSHIPLPQAVHTPMLASISPMPLDLPSSPVAVAVESPYPYQEYVLPVNQQPQLKPQTVVYGHFDPQSSQQQNLWYPSYSPVMEQPQRRQ